jgi:hypothetical protein
LIDNGVSQISWTQQVWLGSKECHHKYDYPPHFSHYSSYIQLTALNVVWMKRKIIQYMRYDTFMIITYVVFVWFVTPYSLVGVYQHSGTLVTIYKATEYHTLKDHNTVTYGSCQAHTCYHLNSCIFKNCMACGV